MLVKQTRIYLIFKYAIYALLAVNVVSFAVEAFGSAQYTYADGIRLSEIIVAYADPIDTAAWLILLLALELETFVIDDEVLTGKLYWGLNAVTAICYLIIIYSFYGYVGTLSIPMGFEAYSGPAPCSLPRTDASFLLSLDRFAPLDAENCQALTGAFMYNEGLNMFGTPEHFKTTELLAWTDIVNAGVWLIIVTVLQLEVYLHSSKLFGTRFFATYKYGKVGLYLILAGACLVWVFKGQPLDAWDALLWLLAFFFIEMNVLNWQEEVSRGRTQADENSTAAAE